MTASSRTESNDSRHRRRRFDRQTSPGDAPGIVDPPLDARTTSIQLYSYSATQFDESVVESVADLDAGIAPDRIMWIRVEGLADAGVIRQLGERFGLHPLALEDVTHVHQRAKVEDYNEFLFVVIRDVLPASSFDSQQIALFAGDGFVLSFQEQSSDSLNAVVNRLRADGGRLRSGGADFLAYALIDAVLDGYFPLLEVYGFRLDALEQVLEASPHRRSSTGLHSIRRDLRLIRQTVWPHRDAVNHLLRTDHPVLSDGVMPYLRDCSDHTVQLIDVLETYREMCSDLRDFHLTQMEQRTNEVMKVLTIIATIFIPLSFITGLYGMNFDTHASPWNMPELEWAYGYPFALALMAVVAGSMGYFFRRRGWLGNGSVDDSDDESR